MRIPQSPAEGKSEDPLFTQSVIPGRKIKIPQIKSRKRKRKIKRKRKRNSPPY